MDHLSAMLEEASDIANVNLDLEPLSVDNESLSPSSSKPTVHKAGKSGSASLKKTWRKPADKPKRPLSAYNIFFQHEREKIISNNPDAILEDVLFKIKNTIKPKKRRHRKSHGMIGFAQLARTIAEKWKTLESGDKEIYEAKAAIEKGKYREQLEDWAKAREEKAREDEKKSPFELARVEVVHNDDDQIALHHQFASKQGLHQADKFTNHRSQQDSLSALLMNARNPLTQMPQSGDVRDYLAMTQQTLEMAKASLSLPLFANLQVQQQQQQQQQHQQQQQNQLNFADQQAFGNFHHQQKVQAPVHHNDSFTPYFGMNSFECSQQSTYPAMIQADNNDFAGQLMSNNHDHLY